MLAAVVLFNLGLAFRLLLNFRCTKSRHRQTAATYYRFLIRFFYTFKSQGCPLTILYVAAQANLAGIYMEEYDYDLLHETAYMLIRGILWFEDEFEEKMEELARISASLGQHTSSSPRQCEESICSCACRLVFHEHFSETQIL